MTTDKIVKRFCEHCRSIKIVFNEYIILYETNEVRRQLLSEVAQNFFNQLHDVLIEYILLNMSKLTDPAHSHKRYNLTVKYMIKLIGPEISEDLGLNEISKPILAIRPYIRDARNKILAHSDKETLLGKGTLGAFPREIGDSFWIALKEFTDKIYRHYHNCPFVLDPVNMYNARDLIEALKKSVHYDDYFKGKGRQKLEERDKMRFKDA